MSWDVAKSYYCQETLFRKRFSYVLIFLNVENFLADVYFWEIALNTAIFNLKEKSMKFVFLETMKQYFRRRR